MSNIYLVTLLISNATGHVESIEAVDAVTQGGCVNKARMLHVTNDPTPPGYELKFTCGTREALKSAVAQHHCSVAGEKSTKGGVATTYACDPSFKNKVAGWVKSVL